MNLKQIDENIRKLRGLAKNVNVLIATTACAIVEHAFGTGEGQGSGDVSRAQKLLASMPNSMNRTYLIRWFRQAGIAINPNDGYAAKVVSKDSKDSKPANERIEFAKANNWFDAVNEKTGERAPWYQGPTPKEQEPNTMLDFADNILGFVDRTAKQVREGKLKNSDKPLYALSDDDRAVVSKLLGGIQEMALVLKDRGTIANRQAELETIQKRLEEGARILDRAPEYKAKASETVEEVTANAA